MRARSQFSCVGFVHLVDGLVATAALPFLIGAVPRVVLVDLDFEYSFSWQAHWPGGEFAARVTKRDPGPWELRDA